MNSIERLIEQLNLASNEALLVTSDINRRYLSSFKSSAGVIVVTNKGAYMLMDFRYAEAASYKAKNVKVIQVKTFQTSINEILKDEKIKTIHLEGESLTYSAVSKYKEEFEKVDVEIIADTKLDKALKDLRMVKTEDEIKKIQAAQDITDAAFKHALTVIKEGITEREVALEIEFFMLRQGADCTAFDSIVVAGPNTSQCHGVPSSYKMQKGDLITMDTGARLDGYNSDMTRTIGLGYLNEDQKDIYNCVLKAHLAVLDATKPGVACSDLDKIARDIIEPIYPGAFGHGLGHGVGLEIHEAPSVSHLGTTVLESGMVITDEPGIYVAGKGGVRIEDTIVITNNGYSSFANSPKELIIL